MKDTLEIDTDRERGRKDVIERDKEETINILKI